MSLSKSSIKEYKKIKKGRRKLLPWWIKVFCWIFMLLGLLSVICLILGFTNIKPDLALYGFETNEPLSLYGLLIIAIGIFKGFTAFSLWFEKDFAIKLALLDATIGILLCVVSMLVLPFILEGSVVTIRLELLLLVPFLLKLNNIEKEWGLARRKKYANKQYL